MNKKLFSYFMIALAIVVSLGLSSVIKKELFVADTPQLRPLVGEYIVWRMKTPLRIARNIFFKNRDTAQVLNDIKKDLKPVAKGVRAAEEQNVSVTQYTLGEVEYVETTYTLSDGRKITVRSPKGFEPPPKEMFEGR